MIRSFWSDTDCEIWLSIEALQALQIVTNWVPGVLSPRLEVFNWASPHTMRDILGPAMASLYPHFMSLFLAPTVIDLDINVDTQHLLYSTLIQSQSKALHSRLKVLAITDYEEEGRGPKDMLFIHNYLTSGVWTHLESLQLPGEVDSQYLTSSTLSHIASLPRLAKLELSSYIDQPSLEHPNSRQEPQFYGLPGEAFPSLRELKLRCTTIPGIAKALQHFPPTNKVANLECSADGPTSHEETQRVLGIVARHFNRNALKVLGLVIGRPMDISPATNLEPDDNDGLYITPLLAFNKLIKLNFDISTNLRSLTPELLR
ncbi:hypothetical protein FA13DRAFT_258529 [Coprinellus micaceus]|uniref:F-box domain-containing protein n=1 Tax=Coprinellus micaceus TaxID=71717 RepID=A0A4Y7TE76_COPMI|nr:hypothetical protein FA13DRAFT_258529 [Coprinellus micaceus]